MSFKYKDVLHKLLEMCRNQPLDELYSMSGSIEGDLEPPRTGVRGSLRS